MITSEIILAFLVTAAVSYLIGSVNTAIVVSKLLLRDDVRLHGSGNAGMTNMLRTYGKGPAVLTALGDLFKGVAAVFLGRLIFSLAGFMEESGFALDAGYVAGLFVLLGHLFPVYFRFKGGKGVMTTLGVILTINPLGFLAVTGIFVPLVFITRFVSLSSVLGALVYPAVTWATLHYRGKDVLYDTVFSALISLIIIIMHKDNIRRLLNGTENRFGRKGSHKK